MRLGGGNWGLVVMMRGGRGEGGVRDERVRWGVDD